MYQKFFTDTYVSKTIQNIVKNTNIFTVPVVQDNDYIIQGCRYIYKFYLISANRNGLLTPGSYSIMQTIYPGLYYPNITHKITPKYGFYDTNTHIYLGRTLRQFRDIYGIDLMPFYNCFSYKMETKHHLSTVYNLNGVVDVSLQERKDENYKSFLIPIFFNKTYTIAIDSPTGVLMKPVFCDDLGFIKNTSQYGPYEYLHDFLDIHPESQQGETVFSDFIKTSTQFSNPFTINVPIQNSSNKELEKIFYRYFNNLYLMIQVSKINSSSIVVLEGDYTRTCQTIESVETATVDNDGEPIDRNTYNAKTLLPQQENQMYLSKLSLLANNDGVCYPFSDRLIEYLVSGVVTPREYLSGNISAVQEAVGISSGEKLGIWNNGIREKLYNYYMNVKGYQPVDNNGYLDKDIEKLLMLEGKMI